MKKIIVAFLAVVISTGCTQNPKKNSEVTYNYMNEDEQQKDEELRYAIDELIIVSSFGPDKKARLYDLRVELTESLALNTLNNIKLRTLLSQEQDRKKIQDLDRLISQNNDRRTTLITTSIEKVNEIVGPRDTENAAEMIWH